MMISRKERKSEQKKKKKKKKLKNNSRVTQNFARKLLIKYHEKISISNKNYPKKKWKTIPEQLETSITSLPILVSYSVILLFSCNILSSTCLWIYWKQKIMFSSIIRQHLEQHFFIVNHWSSNSSLDNQFFNFCFMTKRIENMNFHPLESIESKLLIGKTQSSESSIENQTFSRMKLLKVLSFRIEMKQNKKWKSSFISWSINLINSCHIWFMELQLSNKNRKLFCELEFFLSWLLLFFPYQNFSCFCFMLHKYRFSCKLLQFNHENYHHFHWIT